MSDFTFKAPLSYMLLRTYMFCVCEVYAMYTDSEFSSAILGYSHSFSLSQLLNGSKAYK